MFKFRDKKQLIGTILGSVCFIPSFLIAYLVGVRTNLGTGIWIMLISQVLWLTSIELVTWSLENENRTLKDKLNKSN